MCATGAATTPEAARRCLWGWPPRGRRHSMRRIGIRAFDADIVLLESANNDLPEDTPAFREQALKP
eukprot:scaffold46953_cov62-Phaeocystis_antarctica.AAC.5